MAAAPFHSIQPCLCQERVAVWQRALDEREGQRTSSRRQRRLCTQTKKMDQVVVGRLEKYMNGIGRLVQDEGGEGGSTL